MMYLHSDSKTDYACILILIVALCFATNLFAQQLKPLEAHVSLELAFTNTDELYQDGKWQEVIDNLEPKYKLAIARQKIRPAVGSDTNIDVIDAVKKRLSDAWVGVAVNYEFDNSMLVSEQALSVALTYADSAILRIQRGYLNQVKLDYRGAESEYKIALEIDSDNRIKNSRVYSHLGLLYLQTGSREKAIDQYKKSVISDEDYANSHFALGILYLEDGDKPHALPHFLKYIELEPFSEQAEQVRYIVDRIKGHSKQIM